MSATKWCLEKIRPNYYHVLIEEDDYCITIAYIRKRKDGVMFERLGQTRFDIPEMEVIVKFMKQLEALEYVDAIKVEEKCK